MGVRTYKSVEVVKNALQYSGNNNDTLDLIEDIKDMLRKLNREDRLLILSLASGLTLQMLFDYYSTDIHSQIDSADKRFCNLLDSYLA
jgi:hypothetical protein